MARPPNTEARRAQIARALIQVMARSGYDGASVAEVARTARLNPGLVHYHFKNKQEILLAAIDELVAQHDDRVAAHLEKSPSDPAGQLIAFIEIHLGRGSTADPDALACWVLIGGEALRQAEVKAPYQAALERWTARLRTIVEAGVRSQGWRCADPQSAASGLMAVIQGFFGLSAAVPDLVPTGSAVVTALRMAEGLLNTRLERKEGSST